jgi:type IV secretory pathway TraG/TraD family ATPase VirD4
MTQPLAAVRQEAASRGIYLGAGTRAYAWSGAQQAVLVLGPPRSGKTSSLVIPAVISTPGSVVSTSTKPDVLRFTAAARQQIGPCFVYDPSGTVSPIPGVEAVRWSPVTSCQQWDGALIMARSLVEAPRGVSGRAARSAGAGTDHWTERAESLLAPILHAAALEERGMRDVLAWVDRRQSGPALAILDREGAEIAGDVLAGIAATESREQSAIWSTTSGVLAAYRSVAARESTVSPNFDAASFCEASGTLYICATGRHQDLMAPLVVGILTEVRAAVYAAARTHASVAQGPPQVLFALDEVANIAPLPDFPAMVSEGGGQGVLTLACLQDLSQARSRWGASADGFLSLFGTTVVLPGIGDVRTLDALSVLAGEEQVMTRSVSTSAAASERQRAMNLLQRVLLGPRGRTNDRTPAVTTASARRRRLPVDVIARGAPGMALVVDERNRTGWVRLTPWFAEEPWRSAGRSGARYDLPGASGRETGSQGQDLGRSR